MFKEYNNRKIRMLSTVMSRTTVRIFVEKVLTNQHFYREKENIRPEVCHIETDRKQEGMHMAICLNNYNVYKGDGRDPLKRERFFVNTPEKHLFNQLQPWYYYYHYYLPREGLDCCSNYSIAYHYITNQNQYRMYFLNYKLQTFGIIRRFPVPPKKKNFTEVVEKLKKEDLVKTKYRD